MKRAPRSAEDLLVDMDKMNKAMALAARDARLLHKQTGHPLVVWRDGEVTWIPADELEVADDLTEDTETQSADAGRH